MQAHHPNGVSNKSLGRGTNDLVLCADEKPVTGPGGERLPALRSTPVPVCLGRAPGLPWGRYQPKTGIAAFGRLVEQAMSQDPSRSLRRVF